MRPLDFAPAVVRLLYSELSALVVLVVDEPDALKFYCHRVSLS